MFRGGVMQVMTGRGRKRMKAAAVLILILLTALVQTVYAENMFTTRLKDAVSSVYNIPTSAAFSIVKIVPVTSNNHVEIYFSDACRLEDLRRSLKLIPT